MVIVHFFIFQRLEDMIKPQGSFILKDYVNESYISKSLIARLKFNITGKQIMDNVEMNCETSCLNE